MKKTTLVIVCSLVLIGLPLIFLQSLDVLGYEGNLVNQYYYAIPDSFELKGNLVIGQTFLAPQNNLQRIDVAFRTFGRRNTHDVTFYLKPAPESSEVIYQETFNASEVNDYHWRTFLFPPIPDSGGKSFFFYFASPDSVNGNAITVGGAQGDWYHGGTAYFGPIPTDADIAFLTYYGLSPREKLTFLSGAIVKARPSLWGDLRFYLLLLLLYVLILLRIFVKLIKLV